MSRLVDIRDAGITCADGQPVTHIALDVLVPLAGERLMELLAAARPVPGVDGQLRAPLLLVGQDGARRAEVRVVRRGAGWVVWIHGAAGG